MKHTIISGRIRDLDDPVERQPDLTETMPLLAAHLGTWSGQSLHYSPEGKLLEEHAVRTRNACPESGPYAYVQRSHFIWGNGHEYKMVQKSVFRDGKLWWDTGQFSGCIWETDFEILLVNMSQNGNPHLSLTEMVCLEPDGKNRSRTKQWFKDGKLFRRTLCNERRIFH